MKLFFLGTGAAEGVPALFCDCDQCEEARRRGGRDRRTRSSILLDDTIKIDLSPDTLAQVHLHPEIRLSRLEHLLFTHSHDDHFAVRELQYLSPNFAPNRKEPLHVWGMPELLCKMTGEMTHFFEEAPLQFHGVVPFDSMMVGHLKVIPITAHHKHDEHCLNYLITSPEGKTMLYGTDTGWYSMKTWDFMVGRPLDFVVLECGKGISNNGYDGHMNLEDVLRFQEKLIKGGGITDNTPFYLTHIAHTGLLLHEEFTERVAPYNIKIAYDGLTCEI